MGQIADLGHSITSLARAGVVAEIAEAAYRR